MSPMWHVFGCPNTRSDPFRLKDGVFPGLFHVRTLDSSGHLLFGSDIRRSISISLTSEFRPRLRRTSRARPTLRIRTSFLARLSSYSFS